MNDVKYKNLGDEKHEICSAACILSHLEIV